MQPGNIVGPVIVAIGVVIAAIAFAVISTLLQTADAGADLRMSRLEEALATAEADRARLRADLAGLRTDLARLREDMSLMANRTATPDPTGFDLPDEDFENPPETEALTEAMLLAKTRFNKGVTQPKNRVMMEVLGAPRDNYSTDCQSVTNPRLKALMETRQIGPIRVTMLRPALDSLERIMDRLNQSDPDIHDKIGTAGAVCARFIRGSTTSVSNHSWGTAIDLTLAGELDPFADGGTQFGLLILAEYFNDEGWFWGATYGREDSMHFEVGEETLRAWAADGKL
ncbi:M15 family metallopeptidase [Defluviimonas aestuarii]|uniref:M15 family metallopeptidase n=1 Tax=Albidovulum aestuarii TaxID=1130726 RepID=UPI00249BBEA8|nr:M15 family metallopeptidase [Defluviimonas aestuarii]MDI3337743.1 M15 family metallopeptidase [Defluviimonas aestuarii]